MHRKKGVKMATIRETKRNGKVTSYRFVTCLDRDTEGKQIREYLTWKPPENLTPAKARKAAERAAAEWEQEVRGNYQQKVEEKNQVQVVQHVPPERKDDFVSFVNDTFFIFRINRGAHLCSSMKFCFPECPLFTF